MGKLIIDGIWINQDVKPRKYIVVSKRFDGVYAAACPCVGQVATNSKLIAYLLYNRWVRFYKKNLKNGNTIAVSLLKRNDRGNYDAIER